MTRIFFESLFQKIIRVIREIRGLLRVGFFFFRQEACHVRVDGGLEMDGQFWPDVIHADFEQVGLGGLIHANGRRFDAERLGHSSDQRLAWRVLAVFNPADVAFADADHGGEFRADDFLRATKFS